MPKKSNRLQELKDNLSDNEWSYDDLCEIRAHTADLLSEMEEEPEEPETEDEGEDD